MTHKTIIIGSGPAGYTAAIYAGRANMEPVVYSGLQPGGQLTQTTIVENFPGYPQGVDANQMMMELREQAERFGADVRDGLITDVDFSQRPYRLTTDRGENLSAHTVIIATGASAKYLGLADEQTYMGRGVSACATCDGFFYRKKTVAVVGGGDTACEEATYLAGLCKQVYLVVRKPYLRASKPMQERVLNTPNIEVLFEHTTQEVLGDDKTGVNGVQLLNTRTNQLVRKPIDGFFLAIGHQPNSDLFKPWVDTDEAGYIKTIAGTSKTNVEGVFACGDVQDPHYRQAITAAGSGCRAAIDVERYLGSRNF